MTGTKKIPTFAPILNNHHMMAIILYFIKSQI